MKIYNYKCCYCGNSINNIDSNLFEIDHYICESSFKDNVEAGRIENLVLACYECNRAKSNYIISNQYLDKLNPDKEYIKNIFFRDNMYYIRINDEYSSDKEVLGFYKILNLEYEVKRLDFLLMNIRGMCERLRGTSNAEKLNIILNKLQSKRNLASFTNK